MKKIFTIIIACLFLTACKKQDEWLDIKSNKADVVPASLKDLQALLDNESIMNYDYPGLGMIGADNFYNTDVVVLTDGNVSERNAYRWMPDIYEGLTGSLTIDWNVPYKVVSYCNVALSGIEKIGTDASNMAEYNNIRGNALFHRSFAYFNLLQLYAKPYDKTTSVADPGVPLKFTPDVNEKVSRATVQQVYSQILGDLSTACEILPALPQYKTRASKVSAYSLLARVYLNMGDYSNSLKYANESLKINGALLNFSIVNSAATYPFPTYQANNPEINYYALTVTYASTLLSNQLIDEGLYGQYLTGDLRKTLFFRLNSDGSKSLRGRYTGSSQNFSGLATNELYLIKSECEARLGNISDSMNTLNSFLKTRWAVGLYRDYSAANETDALNIILKERRKELPYTGNIRWEDLRRLNKDPRFAKTLTRTVAGQTYTLPPNDPRYVLPIVPAEIQLNGLEQNQR